MSLEDLASLEDTLELLSNPTALADIEQARQEAKSGKLLTAEQLRAKYLTK
jgi:PHD/YefM family antitoxin component YafN of YafNO toxin-antitoxin module